MSAVPTRKRTGIPLEVQVRVFRRDGWLCRWCLKPTIFGPAVKYLERLVRESGVQVPLAYYHLNYRRDASPLLDLLAAVVDHVEAFSTGGAHGEANFVTACNKCNGRKNARNANRFLAEHPLKPVKGKHGEPKHWDGLSTLFLVLAAGRPGTMTASEARWFKALSA